MRQLDPQCSNSNFNHHNSQEILDWAGAPSPPLGGEERVGEKKGGSSESAFSTDFLAELSHREPAPATPEADLAGPWRVVQLYGAGDPRWACLAAGERRPRITLQAPDLAYLAAAALAFADRPPVFRFQEDADQRLHLLQAGHPIGTVPGRIPPGGDTLPILLTALADLRIQPLPFAHYLLSISDETLRRAGAIAVRLLREAGR
jgi:hypothetical protein